MSDTPTYASLVTRLFSTAPADRAAVVAHLLANPADAHAVEAAVRDHLRSRLGLRRLVAADSVLRVYGDPGEAVPAVTAVLRAGGLAWATAEVADLVRSIGCGAARTDGPEAWKELFFSGPTDAGPALLMGLAEAAHGSWQKFEALAPAVCHLSAVPELRVAVGAALWRVTWRVNRDWLASLDPAADAMKYPGLRGLVLDVLTEHLGRKPDLAPLVRDQLASLAAADPPAAAGAVRRLARLGSRGWGVLVPMLRAPRPDDRFVVTDPLRRAIFREAADCPAVLPLVHHHAHAVIAEAAAAGESNDLVPDAARVLAGLGPAAGMAVPELLNLAVRVPTAGSVVGEILPKVAAGFPNTPAAVVRALDRVRAAAHFGARHLEAFEALARALAELDPDAGPALVERTGIDPRVPDLLLQQPGWKDAAPEVRRGHAGILADALASPRAEVRLRAAELLRHYRDELPAVWPSLVAVLAGPDEKAAAAVLPHFRHLGSVAGAVSADLVALFREKNPAYAARAVVALWRLGRMPDVASELRAAVERDPEGGWGWAVLRGVIDRAAPAHGLLADLTGLFAASPATVAERVAALIDPPESPEEQRITRCLPRPGESDSPAAVDWDALHAEVRDDGVAGMLLFLAVMCEFGSAGFGRQKVWLIKHHRDMTRELSGSGLAESKGAVERAMAAVERPGASTADRRAAVRGFFANKSELPSQVVELLKHPVSWYRWAGLELADAWGLTPAEARELTGERVWDDSPRVCGRALRMVRG